MAELTPEQMKQLEQFAPQHARVVRQLQRQERRASRQAKSTKPVAAAPSDELVIDLDNYIDRLSVGDLEDMETASGVPAIGAMVGFGKTGLRGMAALIWVLQRKIDPKFTYKQALALPAKTLFDAMRAMGAKAEDVEEAVDEDGAPLELDGSLSA
jgi:hypothetical protein